MYHIMYSTSLLCDWQKLSSSYHTVVPYIGTVPVRCNNVGNGKSCLQRHIQSSVR